MVGRAEGGRKMITGWYRVLAVAVATGFTNLALGLPVGWPFVK
jgi:hypothetical protein